MHDRTLLLDALTHQAAGIARRLGPDPDTERDRGAVSIETVLWYAAAAVSVAVVAAIIWGQIRDTARTTVDTPAPPA